MIYLMAKQHNVTGLKYLCKKETNDKTTCFSYLGSGKRWLNHLGRHGSNIHTEILFETEDKGLFREVAGICSRMFNVVDSNEWANLVEETGSGGDTSKFKNYVAHGKLVSAKLKGKKKSEKHKAAMRGKRPDVQQAGGKNNNAKPIITPFGIFPSIRTASEALNIRYSRVYYDVSTQRNGYNYTQGVS